MSFMINDISDRDVGPEGIEPDTDSENEDH